MHYYESLEQRAVIKWARLAQKQYPPLKWLHCSLSGVKLRSPQEASRLKAEGLVSGICDLMLPFPKYYYCPNQCGAKRFLYAGLYIEMKKRNVKGQTKGLVSASQKEFIEYANNVGYKAIVCYGAEEAISSIKEYLKEGD